MTSSQSGRHAPCAVVLACVCACALLLAACTPRDKQVAASSPASPVKVEWPHASAAVPPNEEIEKRIAALLQAMTLEQKVGQMVQPDIRDVTPQDVRKYIAWAPCSTAAARSRARTSTRT